ncbi:MAG: cytochrome c3 family protein [Candidatus Limnocylindrales bacterium]
MRKLMLLLAAGSLWLFLAAIPALADGGPHSVAKNSGAGTGSTLTSDSCAGCHRAHTGQGSNLIAAPNEEALCFTCHGTAGTGATTNVEDGVQYTLANPIVNGNLRGTELGALRGGGFKLARIGSTDPYRLSYNSGRATTAWPGGAPSFHVKVSPLAAGAPVTSAHIALTGTAVVAKGIAWGNGAISATANAGTALSLECTSCHNPHGNANYRILVPIPTGPAPFVAATTAVNVTDDTANVDNLRNYTVIQTKGGTGTLTAAQVAAIAGVTSTSGDYFRRAVPWYTGEDLTVAPPAGTYANDAPNGHAETAAGLPATTSFNRQITNWCATCHTRYMTAYDQGLPQQTDSGDATFKYRHGTARTACTVCHVAHGSNALMPGGTQTNFSGSFPYPDNVGSSDLSGSSRLLKVDNRGTCQMCHDPTGTVGYGVVSPAGATQPSTP